MILEGLWKAAGHRHCCIHLTMWSERQESAGDCGREPALSLSDAGLGVVSSRRGGEMTQVANRSKL
jgi:hypothetical protein